MLNAVSFIMIINKLKDALHWLCMYITFDSNDAINNNSACIVSFVTPHILLYYIPLRYQ